MSKIAFSLIELILVIVLMGIISFLTIKLPSYSNNKPKITQLRDFLSPDGNTTLRCIKYIYNGNFIKSNNTDYYVKNGIGDSFILKCDDEYYVFKPFKITKYHSFQEAKNNFLNTKYLPKKGFF